MAGLIILIIVLTLIGVVYSWRYTPYGLLDFRTAMFLKFSQKKEEQTSLQYTTVTLLL